MSYCIIFYELDSLIFVYQHDLADDIRKSHDIIVLSLTVDIGANFLVNLSIENYFVRCFTLIDTNETNKNALKLIYL